MIALRPAAYGQGPMSCPKIKYENMSFTQKGKLADKSEGLRGQD